MKKILFRIIRLWLIRRLRSAGWTWNKINTLLYAAGNQVIYDTKVSKRTGKEHYTFGPYKPRFSDNHKSHITNHK